MWPYFHAPVILPYILKTISWINVILGILAQWHHEWHHNKCSFVVHWFWPYTLNVIWCMNIIIWDYESVWSDSWPESKCRSLWPIFYGPVILCYILKTYGIMWPIFHSPVILSYLSLFDALLSYLHIMTQCDPNFDLKVNINQHNLYFMV